MARSSRRANVANGFIVRPESKVCRTRRRHLGVSDDPMFNWLAQVIGIMIVLSRKDSMSLPATLTSRRLLSFAHTSSPCDDSPTKQLARLEKSRTGKSGELAGWKTCPTGVVAHASLRSDGLGIPAQALFQEPERRAGMAAAPPAITNPQAEMPALRRRGPLLFLYLFFTRISFCRVKFTEFYRFYRYQLFRTQRWYPVCTLLHFSALFCTPFSRRTEVQRSSCAQPACRFRFQRNSTRFYRFLSFVILVNHETHERATNV